MHRSASHPSRLLPAIAGGLALWSGVALAAEPLAPVPPAAEPTAAASVDEPAAAPSWFRRHHPRPNSWELGVFGGVWIPSDDIELHAPALDFGGYRPVAADVGVRVGYFPLRHFGLEAEMAFMPSGLEGGDELALVYSARAHAVLQLGIGRIVPFVLIGGGVLAVSGDAERVGSNADEALQVGGGIKIYATRDLVVRLDARDVMSPQEGIEVAQPSHNVEVLLGLAWALGPRRKPAPVPSASPVPPPADADDDGFADPGDACPRAAGVAPDGCPIRDADDDGFLDPDDACLQEIGVAPDGCPIRDVDDDGILPPDDGCPDDPETVNAFEDEDGCPDELPPALEELTGTMEGIYFETGKSTISERSLPALDAVVKVLTDFGELRVHISGHTDDRGRRDYNLELSRARAEAVKDYLAGKGIDAARIETRGAGPDEPVAPNSTRAGRSRNRRIELELLPR